MDKIKQAELLARFVHCGQKRQDGEDYIEHPARLVEVYKRRLKEECDLVNRDDSPYTETQIDIICARWLHDCLEDCEDRLGVQHIIGNYFSSYTMWLVAVLTHEKYESYNEYIERLSQYRDALDIKWNDMIDNTSYKIPKKQYEKYRNAVIFLQTKGIEVPDILLERLNIPCIRECEVCNNKIETTQHSDDFICDKCLKK